MLPTVHQTPIEIHTACGDVTCSFKEQLMRAVLRESILTANSFVILLDMVKNVATMIYLSGYFSGKTKYLLQSAVPHCLHTTKGDNPDRSIVPSFIVCFSILDACSTWICAFVTNRIRMDGTAQRQCKIMPDTLVRCKRISPLFKFQ